MNKKYMTIVIEYEAGAELPTQITSAFAQNVDYRGVKITAVSLDDEIMRVEKLEELLA